MTINAYVIRLKENETSVKSAQNLIESSRKVNNEFEIVEFDAITPERVNDLMKLHDLKWNYPWQGSVLDLETGLLKTAYRTAVPEKRIACFLSHYLLWKNCVQSKESMFIFEHDAIFKRNIEIGMLNQSRYDIIALNDPIGATRKAMLFAEEVKKGNESVVGIPSVDSYEVPQGLPGNSAYYIKPAGARKLISLVKSFGAWPNDAIMCRQLMPNQLGIVKQYCTRLQKMESTTTL